MANISPLVATFIFIGISVGIGVLILNLATNNTNTECAKIDYKLTIQFCEKNNKLIFKIDNKGIPITGFNLYLISDNYDLYIEELRGVKKSRNYEANLPIIGYIELVPQIGDNKILCTSKKQTLENLKQC
jgi:hypothetical protein